MKLSQELFTKAKKMIPGGVNSPVRAFNAVGGTPIYFDHGKGPYLFDVDGQRYIDFISSWGPLILGHADPEIVKTLQTQATRGLSFGAPTPHSVRMAELLCEHVPSLESVRMVNSGTEATMSAIRLARGFTGRRKVLKFEGCYHGHVDSLLVKAGSGLLTLGISGTPGVPDDFTQHTLTARFNELSDVEAVFERFGEDIAAIIVEPIPGNMGCILPQQGFLQGLREICDRYQSLLIFDEVISGFRVALGGAQSLYEVTPDLTTLGKIIGGGMPVGAFGGKQAIMAHLAPMGPVYQAGTLSGNPLALAVGIATIERLIRENPYPALEERTRLFLYEFKKLAEQAGIPMVFNQVGSMFGFFFTDQPQVSSFAQVSQADTKRYASFFHYLLKKGVYFAPSAFESAFISTTHSSQVLEEALEAIASTLAQL